MCYILAHCASTFAPEYKTSDIMNTKNIILNAGDNIIAQIVCNGNILASVCRNNFSSLDDVVRLLIQQAGRFAGLARVVVRNKTQGWSTDVAVAPRRRTAAGLFALAS